MLLSHIMLFPLYAIVTYLLLHAPWDTESLIH